VKRLIALGFLAYATASAAARPAVDPDVPLVEKAAQLGSGQYVWDSKAASTGSLLLVIDLGEQRAMLYRDDMLIAASTVSTGSEGRETPMGEFAILQKKVVHRSRTYDNAPMPYMQRLTWKGVSMHAGDLPGYPASHGCIRFPLGFARLLFGVTSLGTPVIITDKARVAEQERIAAEYQRATEEHERMTTEQQALTERAFAEFDREMAEHEEILQRHETEMAKYKRKLEVASK
jgi:hypothetical protein